MSKLHLKKILMNQEFILVCNQCLTSSAPTSAATATIGIPNLSTWGCPPPMWIAWRRRGRCLQGHLSRIHCADPAGPVSWLGGETISLGTVESNDFHEVLNRCSCVSNESPGVLTLLASTKDATAASDTETPISRPCLRSLGTQDTGRRRLGRFSMQELIGHRSTTATMVRVYFSDDYQRV